MREQNLGLNLTDLEDLILQLGYSKNVATMVIDFLKSQNTASAVREDLETIFDKVPDFVKQKLKPHYQAKMIDITLELRRIDIHFMKHLFDLEQENARLRLEYALMRQTIFWL